MIFTAIVILFVIFALIWVSVPSVHPKFPPGGSRKPLPFIGDSLLIGSNLFGGFATLHKKHGPVVGVTLGGLPFVSMRDYDTSKKYFMKENLSGRAPNAAFTTLIGTLSDNTSGGIIFSEGPNWQENRRFTLHHLRNLGFGKGEMETLIGEEVLEFLSYIKAKDGQPTEIRSTFNVAVVNALWLITAGKRMDYHDPEVRKIVDSLYNFFIDSAKPIANIGFQSAALNHLFESLGLYNITVAFQNILDFCEKAIAEHLQDFNENDDDKDFIHAYLKDTLSKRPDKQLTSDDYQNLKSLLTDLLFAGTDTTNITMTWTMLFLAKEPEVQERLYKELSEVTANNSRLATMSDKVNTPQMEAFIWEVQRRANIFPGSVPHAAMRDTEIEGYFIPKGTVVISFIQEMLHNEKDFPDPLKFDIDRFLYADGKFVAHPKVVPFGIGKRKCLGETLARMSHYRFASAIIQNFKVVQADPNDELSLEKYRGSPYPLPFNVRFVPRKL